MVCASRERDSCDLCAHISDAARARASDPSASDAACFATKLRRPHFSQDTILPNSHRLHELESQGMSAVMSAVMRAVPRLSNVRSVRRRKGKGRARSRRGETGAGRKSVRISRGSVLGGGVRGGRVARLLKGRLEIRHVLHHRHHRHRDLLEEVHACPTDCFLLVSHLEIRSISLTIQCHRTRVIISPLDEIATTLSKLPLLNSKLNWKRRLQRRL